MTGRDDSIKYEEQCKEMDRERDRVFSPETDRQQKLDEKYGPKPLISRSAHRNDAMDRAIKALEKAMNVFDERMRLRK